MLNKFSTKYRVYWEDTDAGGVVYYANYLKFAERARTDFLRALNINQSELLEKENLAFVVRKCEVEYLSPARLDNLLEVTVEVKEAGASFLKIYQEIKLGDNVLNRINIEIVCVDGVNFKPKRIPQNIKSTLKIS
jgi:acyl-CoA thioester hydrolase